MVLVELYNFRKKNPPNMEVIQSFDMIIYSLVATALFFLEVYHAIGHAVVLFRIRLLPRKDLVRIRYYFLFDTMTVFVTAFMFTGKLRWLASLQMTQHLYFFFTWNISTYTRKVISWSSLDWLKSDNSKYRWEWDVILGITFDLLVHVVHCYLLSQHMSHVQILVASLMAQVGAYAIMFSSSFAWCFPKRVPSWVNKRLETVPDL